MTDRIDLAHEADFTIGRLLVRPSHREIVSPGGLPEIQEPRVMQVLVALYRAGGGILSRDDLVHQCWEGRIVGDDAINRVMSRLRRAAHEAGDAFRIETVTKVGYRLVTNITGQEPSEGVVWPDVVAAREGHAPVPAMGDGMVAGDGAASRRPMITRRILVGGGVAVGGGAALWWALRRDPLAPPTPEVAALMAAGTTAIRQITADGDSQARGLFRRVTELAPDYAQGWASLAVVYGNEYHYRGPAEVADLRTRTREARARAIALDPGNDYAAVAGAALHDYNDWIEVEGLLKKPLLRRRHDDILLCLAGRQIARVGRLRDAADMLGRAANAETSPQLMFDLINWQWGAGRLDDTDRSLLRARQLFPRHFAVWFADFYYKLYTDRIPEAIAMADDVVNRPLGVADVEIDNAARYARAIQLRDAAQIDQIINEQRANAHLACGYAENAMGYAASLGRLDDAFAIAEAYYLNRGFRVPDIRFPHSQGTYTRFGDRRTWYLFMPPTAAMRRDPRFAGLLRDIGLERYWAVTNNMPDFRRV